MHQPQSGSPCGFDITLAALSCTPLLPDDIRRDQLSRLHALFEEAQPAIDVRQAPLRRLCCTGHDASAQAESATRLAVRLGLLPDSPLVDGETDVVEGLEPTFGYSVDVSC